MTSTYDRGGLLAPALLVALRQVQVFGADAEIAGTTTMLAVYAPAKRRGISASLIGLGTKSGTLVASVLWAFLIGRSEARVHEWDCSSEHADPQLLVGDHSFAAWPHDHAAQFSALEVACPTL